MATKPNQPKQENNNEQNEQPVAQPGVTKKGGVDQDIEGQQGQVRQDQGRNKGPNDLKQDQEQQSRDAVGHKPDNRGEAEIREQEGRANHPRGEQGRREPNQ